MTKSVTFGLLEEAIDPYKATIKESGPNGKVVYEGTITDGTSKVTVEVTGYGTMYYDIYINDKLYDDPAGGLLRHDDTRTHHPLPQWILRGGDCLRPGDLPGPGKPAPSGQPPDGDLVEITVEHGKGMVEKILPRRNRFIRPAVANVDALAVFAANVNPVTEPFLIDRWQPLPPTSRSACTFW